ncbi:hypothetical protein RR46_07589 [Papilio xuthus]|uniref:Uncharacterized protein n=1 Tax=Papilio xuthus TaxID=66420 RepID=A0A194Q6X3_PAPXU|nr:hypothetical protein RR46_07589 [Papilio xuthus]
MKLVEKSVGGSAVKHLTCNLQVVGSNPAMHQCIPQSLVVSRSASKRNSPKHSAAIPDRRLAPAKLDKPEQGNAHVSDASINSRRVASRPARVREVPSDAPVEGLLESHLRLMDGKAVRAEVTGNVRSVRLRSADLSPRLPAHCPPWSFVAPDVCYDIGLAYPPAT